jgi:hypothetical protein
MRIPSGVYVVKLAGKNETVVEEIVVGK